MILSMSILPWAPLASASIRYPFAHDLVRCSSALASAETRCLPSRE
jgi:hypothetical protein